MIITGPFIIIKRKISGFCEAREGILLEVPCLINVVSNKCLIFYRIHYEIAIMLVVYYIAILGDKLYFHRVNKDLSTSGVRILM